MSGLTLDSRSWIGTKRNLWISRRKLIVLVYKQKERNIQKIRSFWLYVYTMISSKFLALRGIATVTN